MSKLEIVRTGEGKSEGLTLGDLRRGDIFVFKDIKDSSAANNSPCIIDDDKHFVYLDTGACYSIMGRGQRPVRRITAKLTWDYE